MKILMVNSFNHMRGGAERCFLDLTAVLRQHGHEVIPFCVENERNLSSAYSDYFVSHIDFPTELKKPGLMPKLRVAERVIYSREAKQKIERLIADTQPDLAHLHGIAHEISPSILPALKQAGIPVIQTLHDYKLLCPNTSFVSGGEICEACKGHRYFQATRKRCKRDSLPASLLASMEMYIHKVTQIYERNVDFYISPSKFLKRKVKEYNIKVPVEAIPNFINVNSFQPCHEPENYFIYVGRLANVKGIQTLLAAMRQVESDAKLYIAGRGDEEEALQAYAEKHNLENVVFVGHLATDELIPLMQKAMFTVVPSEWYENYSMTVIESFACGTAVLGANIGGIPEQVKDGWNGLLFESGNVEMLAEKLQMMLDHREGTIEMGRNARRQAEQINSPTYHYRQTIAIYEKVVRELPTS